MKRIIIAFLCLVFSIGAKAQIQTKFWGLELSKSYTSIREARETISSRGKTAMLDESTIVAFGGKFAGHNWDYAAFRFESEYSNNKLLGVTFISTRNSSANATTRYISLHNALTDKYGMSKTYDDSDNKESCWSDGNTCCTLKLLRDEEKEMEWVVSILYYDENLLISTNSQWENEL